MRQFLISTALCFGLAGGASAQGVPTVDTQNIAQEIRQLQQMLEDFGIQSDIFENALEQLDRHCQVCPRSADGLCLAHDFVA